MLHWPLILILALAGLTLNRFLAYLNCSVNDNHFELEAQCQASLALLLLTALAGWLTLAIANLRIAAPLVSTALLGHRGSGGALRFLLAVHSGLWPMLLASLSLIVIHTWYILEINAGPPDFVAYPYTNNTLLQEHLLQYGVMNLADSLLWSGRLILHAGLSLLSLALLCMSRRPGFAVLVFSLLNFSLLQTVFAPFMPINEYGEQFSEFGAPPGALHVVTLLLCIALPLLLILGNLLKRDTVLILATASLAIMRLLHLWMLAQTVVTQNSMRFNRWNYAQDSTLEGILQALWLFNLPYQQPPFSFEFSDMSARLSEWGGPSFQTLSFFRQIPILNSQSDWPHCLALLGNLLWLFTIFAVCLYCVRAHRKEMLS